MAKQHDTSRRRQEFEAIALQYFDAVFSYAMTLARHVDDAEDLTQETFFKAYRAFHQFQAGTNMKAWLLTIVRNTYINRYRQVLNRPTHVDVDYIAPVYAAPALDADWEVRKSIEEWLQYEVHDEVKAALEQLPEIYREAVFLSDVASYSYQEIADIVGCPVGTVMSRLHRGRQLLRTHLAGFVQAHGYLKTPDLISA